MEKRVAIFFKYIFTSLLFLFSFQDILADGVGNFILVKFEIEEEDKVDFANNIEMTISKSRKGNNRELETFFFINGFVVTDFEDAETVDVCFRYNEEDYCIPKIPLSSFNCNWTFGIDEEPFDNDHQPYLEDTEVLFYLEYCGVCAQVDIPE